jgi:hypothetical protein
MSKIIKFQTEKEKNIERLNKLGPMNKILLFYDEVRIPRGTYPASKQHHIQKTLHMTDGDILETEKILREKGFIKRKSSCYDRMKLKDCHLCEKNILHPETKKSEEAGCRCFGRRNKNS